MDPTATYDSFGAALSPDEALPILAVSAEKANYIGKQIKIEGQVVEVCQSSGCWLTMDAGDGSLLRIDVPRDSAGVYVYTFPKDISGRRIIVGGTLASGPDATHEHGDHAEGGDEGHEMDGDHAMAMDGADESHAEAEARAMTVDLAIVATGALVERVRTSD